MQRQIDEFKWHCGPHPCDHDGDDLPSAWRYAVVGRGFALSLCVSRAGGEFHLHTEVPPSIQLDVSAQKYVDWTVCRGCDLLGNDCLMPPQVKIPVPQGVQLPAPPQVSEALMFWSDYAVGGKRDQPERFWRALEKRSRSMLADARRGRYQTTACPRCHGKGTIELKPRKKKPGG